MSIAVVTDSTADIPANLLAERGITTVPAHVRFGDVGYKDRVDISTEEFYSRLATDKDVFPTTANPSIGEFLTVYEDLLQKYDEIVSVHISSKLSGTFASAVSAATQADPSGERVKHIDSLSVSMATGWIALAAQDIIDDGGSVTEVIEAARIRVPRVQFAGTPDTLEYLIRGGRLSGARAILGSMLRVRPVLAILYGQVEVIARPRSHRRAMSKLISLAVDAHEPLTNLATMHTDEASKPEAEELLEDLKHLVLPGGMTFTSTVGPAIGAHLGGGTIAVAVSW